MSLRTEIWRTVVPVLATAAMGLAVVPAAYAEVTVARPGEVEWAPAPPMIPSGAEVAGAAGDPTQEGFFVLLMRFPAGYEVPAHTHPTDEIVTVLSGTLNASYNEALDRESGEALAAGSVIVVPAGHPHMAWADEAVVISFSGEGPFVINYVNPEDDPQQQ